ncbi:MAG TPA: YtxH domain-containing protein [Anaeromyxobacteraceae bacterium]|jgi:hypothetical protein|nr:YtxH domain-containing protein [Anaeromyxobacteraceae bacterium]
MRWSDVADLRWKDVKKAVKGMDRGDVLHRLGLEEHTPTSDFFTGLGLFAVGVLVGAGLGVMFAPKPGAETRSQLTDTLRNRGNRMAEDLGRRMGVEPSQASTPHMS